MGCPPTKPPPKFEHESLEDYYARPDVQSWKVHTRQAVNDQRRASVICLVLLVLVLAALAWRLLTLAPFLSDGG